MLLLGAVPAAGQSVLTLEEAVRAARERNAEVGIARNESIVASNDYAPGNAGFFPSVNLSVRQSRSTVGGFSSGGGGPVFGNATTFDAGLNLSATVFDGLGQFAVYERLAERKQQVAIQADRVEEEVLARVVISYYDVVRHQQQMEVFREAVALSEERQRIAELRRDLGSASELEVRRARVDLNADRAALLRQESVLAGARAVLNQLMTLEAAGDYMVEDTIIVRRDLDGAALREAAMRRNRLLLQNDRARAVAELSRQEVRTEWLPRVSLQAGYGLNEFTREIGLPVSRPGGLTYGLTATVDLFDGFNRRRRLENAGLRVRNAELAVADARTAVSAQLEAASRSYENSLQLVDLEAENVSLAALNVEVAMERFRQGTITSVELREVQSALTSTESRLITARYEAKRAETELLRLSGGLLERL